MLEEESTLKVINFFLGQIFGEIAHHGLGTSNLDGQSHGIARAVADMLISLN